MLLAPAPPRHKTQKSETARGNPYLLQKQEVSVVVSGFEEVSSDDVSVGPATVRAKSMASMTAVSVEDTVPSEANASMTISRNKNQFSLDPISHPRLHTNLCAAPPKGAWVCISGVKRMRISEV